MKILAWPAKRNFTANPYNWLLTTHLEQQGLEVEEFSVSRALTRRYDVFHMHWPESTLHGPSCRKAIPRLIGLIVILVRLRIVGTRIVWTVHNTEQHEGRHPKLQNLLNLTLTRGVDGYILLSENSKRVAAATFRTLRAKPAFVIPHGLYESVYPATIPQSVARRKLGIPENSKVFLYLGSVRDYKNVPVLIEEFSKFAEPSAVLVVAGQADSGQILHRINQLVAGDKRVRWFPGFVKEAEMAAYFSAADIVVNPYRKILNSGSAYLALSYSKPIVAPAMGSLLELREQAGPQWVLLYEGDFSCSVLEDAARTFVSPATGIAPSRLLPDWETIAASTIDAYQYITGKVEARS